MNKNNMNWKSYTANVKKRRKKATQHVDRLSNAPTFKAQVAFYKESLMLVNLFIDAINNYPEPDVPDHYQPFIIKAREKAASLLDAIDFCRPHPPNAKLERLDYHTSKKYK
jgi:hypothetical protein